MSWNKQYARQRTIQEQEALDYINNLLGDSPDDKILSFIQIKCATEDGFFDKMLKTAFKGFYSQNDDLKDKLVTVSNALYMTERSIPKTKKIQKKFNQSKDIILKGLNVLKSYMNIDDIIEEYEDN